MTKQERIEHAKRVLDAIKDGKEVTYCGTRIDPDKFLDDAHEFAIVEPLPAPTYRPYTLDEIGAYALARVFRKDGLGWGIIGGVGLGRVLITGFKHVTTQELLDYWTLIDGKPCGVKVE